MSEQTKPTPKESSKITVFCRRHGFSPSVFYAFLILTAIILALVSYIFINNRQDTQYTSRSIDFGLKDIGELATQAGFYTNVNMINNPNRTIAGIEIPGTSSKSITVYQGTIKAGIDFAQIKIDINKESKIITLTMPPARILSNEIDLDSFEKFDENNSIFNPIGADEFNNALVEMKAKAEAQALANGILDAAKSNAETMIVTMVKNTEGTEDYQIKFLWVDTDTKNEGVKHE